MAKRTQVEGIIYCYTNKVNGKKYIGQTTEERRRHNRFLRPQALYTSRNGGILSYIDKARQKYGISNFEYEVLQRVTCETLQELESKLNELEEYYIQEYNTYESGYNSTSGGEGCLNRIVSEETRLKISKTLMGHSISEETRLKMSASYVNNRKGTKHSEESKKLMSQNRHGKCCGNENGHSKAVLCYTKEDEFVAEFECMVEALNWLGKPQSCTANISACCHGRKKSAYGYKWKLKSNE